MLITTARTTWERKDFIIVFLLFMIYELVLKARMHKAVLPVGFVQKPGLLRLNKPWEHRQDTFVLAGTA
jgi:hypothetical protein